ncbi:MAG: MerR family transcriptional regulator [Clostridia bacterium]|nr:MerR family transcriptional regulator [Clostridia bacterium]
MKKFFTISEFADLRDININSLRYYERIGILTPAYTDPQTKYRYYSDEQLIQLDIIKLAVDLEIPLKTLKSYFKNGALDNITLFEDSKALAITKIKEMQNRIASINYALYMFEDCEKYLNNELYTRTIKKRTLMVKECENDLSNVKAVSRTTTAVMKYAKSKNIPLVFPMGIMILYKADTVKYYVCFHTAIEVENGELNAICLPEAEFECIKKKCSVSEYRTVAESTFNCSEGTIVLAFAVPNKDNADNLIEFQTVRL